MAATITDLISALQPDNRYAISVREMLQRVKDDYHALVSLATADANYCRNLNTSTLDADKSGQQVNSAEHIKKETKPDAQIKTDEICRNFLKHGKCKFKGKCRFVHLSKDKIIALARIAEANPSSDAPEKRGRG